MPAASLVLTIEIDPAAVPDGDLSRVMDVLSDFAPVLLELGEVMGEAQRENFASEGAAFGEPWAALAPSTVREKARLGFPSRPLVRTGLLESSIGQASETSDDSVTTRLTPPSIRTGRAGCRPASWSPSARAKRSG
jgi:hypothetical protein